ncbi:hypothetical protein BDW_04220 [Bdellovibrio bacteriovorus W]|nr:hypothetical protein BDW_04220 [Bdellovibrio bacteriovorus W]
MKKLLVVMSLFMASQAMAIEKGQIVYDLVTNWAYRVSGVHKGIIYITTNEEGFKPLQRQENQLIPSIESLGRLKQGTEVTYYNEKERFMEGSKITHIFPNQMVFLSTKAVGRAFNMKDVRIGAGLLGARISSFEGIHEGDTLCAKNRINAQRGPIRAGTKLRIKKVFDNRSVEARVGLLYYPEILRFSDMTACK